MARDVGRVAQVVSIEPRPAGIGGRGPSDGPSGRGGAEQRQIGPGKADGGSADSAPGVPATAAPTNATPANTTPASGAPANLPAGIARLGPGGVDPRLDDTSPIDRVRPGPWSEAGLTKPALNLPVLNQSGSNQPGPNQPAWNQPGLNQPGLNQPGVNPPSLNQPSANQQGPVGAALGRPAPISPPAERPALGPAGGEAAPAEAGGAEGGGSGTGDDDGSDESRPASTHRARLSPRQQTANAVMVLAALAALFLLGHRFLPDTAGLVSMVETWLPWFAGPVALLLIGALALRSWRAVIASTLAAAVWLGGYGPTLLHGGAAGPGNLMVFSEDLNNGSGAQLAAAGSAAIGKSAALVAVEGMNPQLAASSSTAGLDSAYAYHVTQYEYGVWSRYPISDAEPIDVAVATASASSAAVGTPDAADASTQVVVAALRLQLATPQGQLTVYVVHLPQAVAGEDGFGVVRDAALKSLVSVIGKDAADRMAVVGDFNTAATDREFSELTKGLGLASAQAVAGSGFGFTWPAAFPVVRLDDVLFRGASAVSSAVLPAIPGGATHRPILVDLKL
jgi:vancomycin resistance protein VanJ